MLLVHALFESPHEALVNVVVTVVPHTFPIPIYRQIRLARQNRDRIGSSHLRAVLESFTSRLPVIVGFPTIILRVLSIFFVIAVSVLSVPVYFADF